MRFAIVDIETPLGPSCENFIMLARVKPIDGSEKSRLISLKTEGFGSGVRHLDSLVVAALRDEMNRYDGWITWNGLGFDLPYIDDRLMICSQSRLERRFARGLDAMWHAKMFKSMFQGASLENVALGFGYPGKPRVALNKTIFVRAKEEAIDRFKNGSACFDKIERHNAGCIRLTEFCYNKLKPRIQNLSRWG